jgi:DNA-binding transcriptional ArsR family regulator
MSLSAKKLNKQLTYRSRPIIDFMHALYIYGNLEEGTELFSNRGMELDKEVLEMMDHIDQSLSAFVKQEINTLSYLGIVDCLLIGLISDYDDLETTEDYFKLMKRISLEEFFHYIGGFFLSSYYSGSNEGWRNVKHSITDMKDYIEALEGIETILQNQMVELFEEPEETKMRVGYAIEQFYKKGYRQFESYVIDKSKQVSADYLKLLGEDPSQFIEINLKHASLNGTPPFKFDQYTVYISYMQQFGYTVLANHSLNNPNGTISIGYKNIEFHKSKSIEANFDKFLKIITDPTRFKIMTYVGKDSWYVQALAKELALTPATIHYHLETLHALDIVNSTKDGNKVMYELNRQVTKQYLDYLNRQVLN